MLASIQHSVDAPPNCAKGERDVWFSIGLRDHLQRLLRESVREKDVFRLYCTQVLVWVWVVV